MGDNSKIEWLARIGTKPASWNPLRAREKRTGKDGWFCVHVSDGCRLCYAERMNLRLGNRETFTAQSRDNVEIHMPEDTLNQPVKWRKPRTIFVCSMTDLFGEFHSDDQIERVFATMDARPDHVFIVLTKRAYRMRNFCINRANQNRGRVAPNVWLGVSVEDNRNRPRIEHLRETPAAVRFLSCEPLIGRVDPGLEKIDWVIVGGESGGDARPCELSDVSAIVDQCAAAGVACFVKQLGSRPEVNGEPINLKHNRGGDWSEWPERLQVREWPS